MADNVRAANQWFSTGALSGNKNCMAGVIGGLRPDDRAEPGINDDSDQTDSYQSTDTRPTRRARAAHELAKQPTDKRWIGTAKGWRTPLSDDLTSSRAPAVARAAAILRLLADDASGLGVSDIARKLDLVPSTCLHVLRALVDEGFLNFDSNRKSYKIGVGLLSLVRVTLTNNVFREVVQPTLDRLAREHRVTAVAVELDNRDHMVVVALASHGSIVSIQVKVGSRFPSLLSATGRCIAAVTELGRDQLRPRFERLRWEAPPTFDQWYDEVEQARAEHCAVDRGNYIRGVGIVAALLPPALDGITRGIALVGFEHSLDDPVQTRKIKSDLVASTTALGSHFR